MRNRVINVRQFLPGKNPLKVVRIHCSDLYLSLARGSSFVLRFILLGEVHQTARQSLMMGANENSEVSRLLISEMSISEPFNL
jgi:hypothetical protein